MTVSSTISKIIVNGDAAATTFSFVPMAIFDATQLLVTLIESDGTQVDQILNTDYTVNIDDADFPATGDITYPISGSPLATTESLILKRVLPLTQLVDLENQGGYFPDTQENALDRGIMIDLQMTEVLDRALRLVPTVLSTVSVELPEPEANTILGWNSDATAIINRTGLVGSTGPAGPTGPQGPAGAGTGDMLKANNLSELPNFVTARANLSVYSIAQIDLALLHTTPPGVMDMYAGTSLPAGGWLFCDGAAVSRTAYADLFAVIGTTYGVGDSSTTFNVPNLKGRMPMGVGQGITLEGGLPGSVRALTEIGGVELHTLQINEIPLHGHPYRASYTSQSTARTATTGGLMTWTNGISTQAAFTGTPSNNQGQQIGGSGGGQAHNMMNPFLVLNFIIKT